MQSPETLNALRDAQTYSVSSNNLSSGLTVAGTYHYNVTINNPASSGMRLMVTDIVYFGSLAPTSATVFVGLTNESAATPIPAINLNIGAPASKADTSTIFRCTFNTTALSGAGSQSFQLPSVNGDNILTSPFAIMPGNTVGFDFAKTMTVGLNVSSGYIMVYYFREPVV